MCQQLNDGPGTITLKNLIKVYFNLLHQSVSELLLPLRNLYLVCFG